jgi:hypothetical protein
VQIEKKQNHSPLSLLAAKSSGSKVAQEYAAIFTTRLALARWTRGGDIPHVHCFEHQLPMRAGWYEQAQRDFQAWLEMGGFHRPEPGSLDGVSANASRHGEQTSVLSRKVVVHGGPRTTSRTSVSRALDRDGESATQHRQGTPGMSQSFIGLQSIPRNPDGGRQK